MSVRSEAAEGGGSPGERALDAGVGAFQGIFLLIYSYPGIFVPPAGELLVVWGYFCFLFAGPLLISGSIGDVWQGFVDGTELLSPFLPLLSA